MLGYVFPGQGTQRVGMGGAVRAASSRAVEVFEEASDLAGIDMVALCTAGTEEELTDTRRAQLAIYTVNAATLAVVSEVLGEPDLVAGHSVGEWSAFFAAGAVSFAAGFEAVRERARIMADSAFGCAGQRCLATSVAITVGDARQEFTERMVAAAESKKVGYGLDQSAKMGPVISAESKNRIAGLIDKGVSQGARVLTGGADAVVDGFADGYFVHATLLDDVTPGSEIAKTEVFGPVLSMMHANSLDEAIQMVNDRAYGNQASLFTSSGSAARQFRHQAVAGNIGINLGVAAPMAFFPFSGWSESFFGDLHAQGAHGIEFFTQTKVVVERWPEHWSRTF